MPTPEERPEPTTDGQDASNRFQVGFVAAWGTALMAGILAYALAMMIQERLHAAGRYGDQSLVVGMLPPACLLGLLGWSYFSGRRDMARGVLAAFGSMFAIVLLLVAACFGLFGFNAF